MKKLTLTILALALWAGVASSAELLVQAKPHWMDGFTQKQVDKMTVDARRSYESRAQIGDVIAVRPDGWEWGKDERLPNYLVVRVPDLNLKDAKKYEEPLMNTDDPEHPYLLRKRKHQFSKAEVEIAKVGSLDAIQVNKTVATSKISTKTGLSDEVIQPKKDLLSYLKYQLSPIANRIFNRTASAAQFLYKVVAPSGGDYTALETCMNANEQDLRGDGWFDVEIDGEWVDPDTTEVVIHNYNTDSDDYINIYTTSTARHDGRANAVSGKNNYRLYEVGLAVGITGYTIFLDGIEIYGKNVGDTVSYILDWGNMLDSGKAIITNNIIHDCYGRATAIDITFNKASGNGYIANNIIYNITGDYSRGITNVSLEYGVVYNNTVYNVGNNVGQPGYGFGFAAFSYLKNNISVGCGGNSPYDFATYAGSANRNYNLSSDTSAAGDNSITEVSAVDLFVSITPGEEDLHLKAGAAAIGAGADLGSPYDYDTDGDFRDTYTPWDIGADEYVAAAPAGRTRRFF